MNLEEDPRAPLCDCEIPEARQRCTRTYNNLLLGENMPAAFSIKFNGVKEKSAGQLRALVKERQGEI